MLTTMKVKQIEDAAQIKRLLREQLVLKKQLQETEHMKYRSLEKQVSAQLEQAVQALDKELTSLTQSDLKAGKNSSRLSGLQSKVKEIVAELEDAAFYSDD